VFFVSPFVLFVVTEPPQTPSPVANLVRMINVLANIVEHKWTEIDRARREVPLAVVQEQARAAPPPRDFAGALRQPGTRIIAEVKRASPSAGTIRAAADPVTVASTYAAAGAACVSVLTDTKFFGGCLGDLSAVRTAIGIPVIRKDFILDPYQVYEARAAGADAILLIAECLEDRPLAELHALALELGMSALVELYEPQNLPRVLAISPALVGVNNRDLKTMTVRLEHSLDLRPRVPAGMVFVAESGIKTRADIERLEQGGVNAFLIGETLMRADDPAGKLRELTGA
jgi:indole-3-glycerol phosphate synthase